MVDKTAKSIVRTKYGDANFKYIEKFDSVENLQTHPIKESL
tara:strand:- start:169 stop:291 length:123 start_codon:yes stop_codon:yes gene_type:complete